MKKIILSILVISWMILIFIFSNQNGIKSSKVSDGVSTKVVKTVEIVRKRKYSNEERKTVIKKIVFFVRKTAHFMEYFILGILVYLLFKEYNFKNIYLWVVLFCFIYSITDEVHQMFINERTAKVFDVFVDTSGSIISNVLIYLNKNIVKKFKKC